MNLCQKLFEARDSFLAAKVAEDKATQERIERYEKLALEHLEEDVKREFVAHIETLCAPRGCDLSDNPNFSFETPVKTTVRFAEEYNELRVKALVAIAKSEGFTHITYTPKEREKKPSVICGTIYLF